MNRSLRRLGDWLRADPYRLALIILAIGYCALFTHLAWELHAGMRTHRSDLGQIDQAVWNSSRGRFLEQTDNGFVATRLTDHVEPILVMISPVFWLWDDVRALLLLQSAAAALSVLPLYALALRKLEQFLSAEDQKRVWRREPVEQLARPLAFSLGVAWLLAPQVQSALLTEFHAAPLAAPLILWAFWAVDSRRWGQFIAAALLTALVKEEMALLAAGLGAWAVWRAWSEGFNAETQRRRDARKQEEQERLEGQDGVKISSLRLCASASLRYARSGIWSGLLVLLLGLGWFAVATFAIVPAYAQPLYGTAESTYFARYGALGDSAADIFKSLLTQPQAVLAIAAEPPRVAYLLGLLAAFGFFSLLAPELVLLSLPLLLANLLSAYPAQYYGEFHYSAPLLPYFAAAAAYGLGRLWRFLARRTEGSSAAFQHMPAASGGVMAAASLLQNRRTALRPLLTWALVIWLLAWSGGNYLLHGRGLLGGRYDEAPVTDHHRLLDRFVAQIPADAPLTATAGVHPHVSHRRYIYQFPLGLDPEKTPVLAEWALLDVTTNTDMAPGDLKATVDALLAAEWGVVDAADGFLLLRRGAAEKMISPAFYSFALLPPDSRSLPGAVEGATGLHLLDVAAQDWPRWRQTRLVLDWQVGADFDPAQAGPSLEVVTPDGGIVATLATAAPPALVWLPPDQWQPGDTVRVTTLPMTLPRAFAVRAAGDAPGNLPVFARQPGGELHRLTALLSSANDPGTLLAPALGPLQASGPIGVQLPDGRLLRVQGWLPDGRLLRVQGWLPDQGTAGRPLDILLQWGLPPGLEGWPPELAAFVHLRAGGETVAQADGAPQLFGRPSPPFLPAPEEGAASGLAGAALLLNDWRQVTPENQCPVQSPCQVVIGVYDPATGARLPLLDEAGAVLGDEFVLGTVPVGPSPLPDQACALVGACE